MRNIYKNQWWVWVSLSVLKRRRVSKNGQFCSQPAGLMPFPHAGLTTFGLCFPSVASGHLHQYYLRCLLNMQIASIPLSIRNRHLQLSPRGLLPSKFEKSGFKDLELPITSDPKNISVPGTGVHWSFWGLVSATQSWGHLPQQLWWAAGKLWSVLGQIGWPALSFPREGLEALGCRLMCWWRWGLGWCLHIGEGRGIAVTGCSPHRGLQHVHGVIPLAAGTGDCIKWCSRAGQRAGQWGRVLPWCFGWPRFGFVILGNRREFLVSFLVSCHCDLPTQHAASHSLAQGKLLW